MKNNYFLLATLLLFTFSINAQFVDDMESYIDGEPINEYHWTDVGCGGGVGCSILSTSLKAHSGSLSGYIPADGTTKAVLDLGNKIFGVWGVEFWVYIPAVKEAAISLQGIVPFAEGHSIVGDIYFNKGLATPGVGVISDSALGEVSFNFPHNEWFRIVMNWDISTGISLATWQFNVDSNDVLPVGTPYTNENGDPAASLGGIEFFSASIHNVMYVDDFIYHDNGTIGCFPPFPINDNMEYENGAPLEEWWQTPIEITTTQSNSGSMSGVIPDDGITDVVLDLGNLTSGEWDVEFEMYVPSNKVAYWNIQGHVPVGAGEWVVGNFFFNQDNINPGLGLIDDTHLGEVAFNFPHDEWFTVSMSFNFTQGMSGATWGISVDETEVLPEGSPFTNEAGDIPTSLGGISFFSISTDNLYYLDDFDLDERQLGVIENSEINFVIYPNPVNDVLFINSNEMINKVILYDVLGNVIFTTSETNTINTSALAKGIYFVVIETDKGRGTQKLIKN